jgi:acyl carrier protein
MDKNEFLLLLDELLGAEPGTATGAETLESLEGWDSLAVISFMCLADERFGINLQAGRIAECRTVLDLIRLLGNQVTVGACT